MGLKKLGAISSALLLSLSCSILVLGSALQPGNTTSQSSPFVLPIVKRDSLLNGLHLITLEQQNTNSVAAHLRINSGALFDLAGKGGLADLTASMLLRGGGGLNAKNIADRIEQVGMTVSITIGWDSTDIVMGGPADSLEEIFDLLGRLLTSVSFDQAELDQLKAARIASVSQNPLDDTVAVLRKAQDAVFGSHPFGRPAHGTPESIEQIARQDLIYFYNRYYIANNSEVVVSGDVTSEQVTRLGRSKLGSWKKGEKVPPTFKSHEAQTGRRVFILDRSDEQPARAAIAQIGLSRRAEDYFAAVIVTDVLGAQVSKNTAMHAGTTIETKLETRQIAGPLIVSIKAAPADLAADIDVLLDTMSALQTSLSASDQVEAAKARLIASMAERLKTTTGAAEVILDIETFGLGKDYFVTFADRVNAITPSDVQRAAQAYFRPKSVAIAIAGSASRFEASMKRIGTVTVLK